MTDMNSLPKVITPKKASCFIKKILCGLAVVLLVAGGSGTTYFFFKNFSKLDCKAADITKLQQDVSSLNTKTDDLTTRLNALTSKNIETSETSPSSEDRHEVIAPSAASVAHLQNDVTSLSAALSAVQGEIKQNSSHALHSEQTTATSLAAAIAFIELREVATSNQSFSHELKIMEDASKGDSGFQDALNQLAPYAEKGAPTLAELHDQLGALEVPTFQALDRSEAANWWDRLLAEFKSLVSVRRIHGESTTDIFAPLDANLSKGDIGAALASMQMLPPSARNTLSEWREHALARQKIDEALHAIADHFTSLANRSPAEVEP